MGKRVVKAEVRASILKKDPDSVKREHSKQETPSNTSPIMRNNSIGLDQGVAAHSLREIPETRESGSRKQQLANQNLPRPES